MPITINGTQKLQSLTTFSIIECASCGCEFALTETMIQRRLGDGEGFYCPNGHSNFYNDSRETKLQRELEEAKKRIAREVARTDQAKAYSQELDYQLRAQKGNLTKLKKRIGCGVCPCCNRHFNNVERHIASQHPDFTNK